jgi:hypothetical protein
VLPLTHASRGPHPGDAQRFGPPQLEQLRRAALEVAWLLDRGYPRESAVRFVGDRHQLAARQRLALMRGVCSEAERQRRASREEGAPDVRNQRLLVDGLNVLITLEVALAGGPLVACADGAVRDLAGLRGSYRPVQQTGDALERFGAALSTFRTAGAHVYLDAPVSSSGEVRALFLEHASHWDRPVQVDLVKDPDACLAGERHVVTADAAVIDRSASWFNLGALLVRGIEGAWIVAL